jgi:hypothetical protein
MEKKSLLSTMTGTNEAILANRGGIVVTQAKLAQKRLIDEFKGKKAKLELAFNDLTDLAPTNSTALKIETELTTDPDAWVKKVHALEVEMALVEDDIKIAEERYNVWFPEEAANLS